MGKQENKPIISLVAAIDENNALGYDNKLLCHLPIDLKHFKTVTLNKPIVMGRKTFESIGKPLPQRLNIVITSKKISQPDIVTVPSLAEALKLCADSPEIMIIGGGQVFADAISMADNLYLTRIHHKFPNADVFFPKIDFNKWRKVTSVKYLKDDRHQYDFTIEHFFSNLTN